MQLKAWRKAAGLTQIAAAEALGVHRATLIRWEHGSAQEHARLLELACERLAPDAYHATFGA